MKIKCIIIDDEPLSRKGLAVFIQDLENLELEGSFSNPVEAMVFLENNPVDLILLDIQMPKMNGLEFLKTMLNPPLTIITTAYPNFAVQSYEFNVIDYLIKPVPFERFVKAINKTREYLKLVRGTENKNQSFFFIKCDSRIEKIRFDELIYVEAMQNYVMLHTIRNRFVSYLTFKSVEEYLPAGDFLRVQKSFIVNLHHINNIEGNEISIADRKITISRVNKDEILNSILKNRYLKR